MKPFDLEAAKAGKRLVTRDGSPVDAFSNVSSGCDFPSSAHIEGYGWETFTRNGRARNDGSLSCNDLFMAPESFTRYVNLFPDGVAYWFDTEAEARAGLNARALKIAVPVTWEV
jgi:hypothetical protein